MSVGTFGRVEVCLRTTLTESRVEEGDGAGTEGSEGSCVGSFRGRTCRGRVSDKGPCKLDSVTRPKHCTVKPNDCTLLREMYTKTNSTHLIL